MSEVRNLGETSKVTEIKDGGSEVVQVGGAGAAALVEKLETYKKLYYALEAERSQLYQRIKDLESK